MENWVLLRKGADFTHISEKFHISPRVASLIRNREIIGDEAIKRYLNGTIVDLYDGMLMKDMDRAVSVLMERIRAGRHIRVIGDYDIDGIQSTYILLEGFRFLGAEVDSDIPDRMKDGYGLNRQLIDRALEADVDTIVTCDNGIAAAQEIAYAKSMGMTVVVTDHHEVPYQEEDGERKYILPKADAVVDPKRPDCMYPFKGLCGAAVAYKLIEALADPTPGKLNALQKMVLGVALEAGDTFDINYLYAPAPQDQGKFEGLVINDRLYTATEIFTADKAGIYTVDYKYADPNATTQDTTTVAPVTTTTPKDTTTVAPEPTTTPQDTTTAAPKDTTTAGKSEKSGCGSVVALSLMVCIIPAAVVVCRKKH